MPEGPSPRIALSRKKLRETWEESRDSSTKPASPGIDRQTAASFAQNFEANLDRIHRDLMAREFHFAPLRPVIIPKDNGKLRLICVPTVRDRLVQRAIVAWLIKTKRIPHQDFVYGVKDQGLAKAIDRAITLRKTHEWCVKTDIQAFFDNIRRNKLKSLVAAKLKGSSLLPLLWAAIDREAKPRNEAQATEIEQAGIRPGAGVRQGMPLSPLLANLALIEFDTTCKKKGIRLLRYADDILALFKNKAEAVAGFEIIKGALAKLELQVPELGSTKSELIGARDPVSFLGREIVFLDSAEGYVARVGRKKLAAIKDNLSKKYSLEQVLKEDGTLSDAAASVAASTRSYLGTYKDAQNYAYIESELRHHFKKITSGWFATIFGESAMASLTEGQKVFLGIVRDEPLEAVEDIEITN